MDAYSPFPSKPGERLGFGNRLGSPRHPQLGIDPARVRLDGMQGNKQLLGNLLIRTTLRYKA
ncbi:hypothetical protein, partial [Leclercia adecarboxylata]|uniref:hypothetical protein n=1 Tax=Leclercia adecarboxylata TaxID=83655 RepID=UPI003F68AB49